MRLQRPREGLLHWQATLTEFTDIELSAAARVLNHLADDFDTLLGNQTDVDREAAKGIARYSPAEGRGSGLATN